MHKIPLDPSLTLSVPVMSIMKTFYPMGVLQYGAPPYCCPNFPKQDVIFQRRSGTPTVFI